MIAVDFTVSVTDKTPIETLAAKKLGAKSVKRYVIIKKSVDARKKDNVLYNYRVAVEVDNERKFIGKGTPYDETNIPTIERMTIGRKINCNPVVVGSGPAGLFAALTLALLGAKPVVIERGDTLDKRVEKTEKFIKTLSLDTESNVQFGEGGAGTFSDGKLNTGVSNDFVKAVINEFVACGAPEETAYLNKPHVGTDKLIDVVRSLREKIVSLGGTFLFNCRLTDVKTVAGKVTAAVTSKGEIPCDRIYLAIGHSARDTFEMLYRKSVKMTSKTYSMGTRIEHLSKDINFAQYGKFASIMPAADYKIAVSVAEYGSMYSFCMCPGGRVINASSEENGVCVNGMSYHARDGVNSNSALLINVTEQDFGSSHPLAGMEYQRAVERRVFETSAGYKPIVQTVGDFLSGKSGTAPDKVLPSVETGYNLGDLSDVLPEKIVQGIKKGLPLAARKIRGFDSPSAVLTGVESRSSSPVKILRDEKGMSSMEGMYPIGEGAGYAGGITSAAADGIRTVLASV